MSAFTYPGVYIEELSSGVHTITGVATSIAVFIGWAPQGPVTEATLVESWAEYQTQFGGLDSRSFLGYAVNQFFANGGSQAYIIRLVWNTSLTAAPGTTPVPAATAGAVWQKFGVATISAAFSGVTGSAQLAVGADLASIAVSPAAPSLTVGQTQQLAATGTLPDGTTVPLTNASWMSSDASIVTPDNGLITAVAAGSATITATSETISGTTTVTVAAAASSALSSISIASLGVASVPIGKTLQLAATGSYSDGSSKDITSTAAWSSSNAAVATVAAATGVVASVAAGSTVITAAIGSVTATLLLNVSSTVVALASINLTPASASVPVGPQQFKALGIYSDGSTTDLTNIAAWNTGGSADASINASGLMTGTAITGGTPITVEAVWAGITGKASVSILPRTLQSITVTTPNQAITTAQTSQFTATGNYSDGTSAALPASALWSSSAPTIATVNSTGLASPVSAGSTLSLFAGNPGQWANNLYVTVTLQPPPNNSRFSLLVQQMNASGALQTLESFTNLSVSTTDPQYVVTVIDNDSNYISFIDPATAAPVPPIGVPAPTPPGSPLKLGGGADGSVLTPASDQNFELALTSNAAAGVYLLNSLEIFNLLCIPAETDAPTIQTLQQYCNTRRAFYIVDPPQTATASGLNSTGPVGSTSGSLTEQYSSNSAYYFPWVQAPDPLFGNRPTLFPPCGFLAGIYASTDATRGVWKAPAGIDAGLTGVSGLQYNLTDTENGNLNVQGINCLREFKIYGDVVWGARTLQGNDQAGSEWKYVPIRRLALFLESSLYDGTQWVVFEPNDEALWGQIRLNVGAFLQGLFLKGAFQGTTPQQAYFVKCDAENNPQSSIDLGIVNVLVGFAPLYPAEFVVIQIQQMTGQSSS
jgi:phage tail sheath protein FI